MTIRLACVTALVHDQEEALRFYAEKLGFEKRMDEKMGPTSRWLAVAAPGQDVEMILLKPDPGMHGEARAKTLEGRIGQGTTWVIATDDCSKTYETLSARGVTFSSPPKQQPWGMQAVSEDLYGNTFALVQQRQG